MKCVRCLTDNAAKVAEAPDGSKAWEVYTCNRCNFVWRSTEEPEVIDPERGTPGSSWPVWKLKASRCFHQFLLSKNNRDCLKS